MPDLTDRVLAAVAADRAARAATAAAAVRGRRLLPTRIALAMTALAQLAVSAPILLFGRDQSTPVHQARELGSFGAAVSLALLVAAAWPSLAAGSLPVMATAGGLLALTAGLDIVSGHADAVAELPHLLPSLGVLFLTRLVLTWTPPPSNPHGRPDGHRTTVGARLRSAWRRLSPASTAWPAARVRGAVGRVLAAAVLGIGLSCAAASPAGAHAILESSDPLAGSVLSSQPGSVSLHFDEPVSALPGSIKVVDPNGRRVDQGAVSHPGGRGSDVAVDLRGGLARGSYLVAWRVVSADSHPVSGGFTFAIGSTSATASAASLEASSSRPVGVLLGFARFLTYAGLAMLLGGVAFLLVCWPSGWRLRRARRGPVFGFLAVLTGTLIELSAKGAYDAGRGLSGVGRPSLVADMLTTPYGSSLVLRLGALLVVAGWWVLRPRAGRAQPAWQLSGAVLALAVLLSFARAGHANAGSHRALAIASDVAHLAAMAAWLGGLVTLASALLSRAATADPATVAAARGAVTRFSRLAAASVAALALTGLYQSWRQVGGIDALRGTTYGHLLLVKLGLVAVALLAAAMSRRWVRRHYRPLTVVHATVDAPVAAADPPSTTVGRSDLAILRRSVAVEAMLGVVVLAVTAVLVAVQPARTAYRPSVAETLQLGPVTMQVSAVPDADHRMDVHLYAFDRGGAPATPPEVTARLDLPARELGPIPLTLRSGGPGHWLATATLPVPGEWRLKVSARTTEVDVYSGDVTLPVR